MRGQASMEFSLIFTFAFIFFIIIFALIASTTIGLGDRSAARAGDVLDTVAVYAATAQRFDPPSELAIEFEIPDGTLSSASFAYDSGSGMLSIVEGTRTLASRTVPGLQLSASAVEGSHAVRANGGVVTLA